MAEIRMGKSKSRSHRKIRESDIHRTEMLCSAFAFFAVVLCVLFLSGILRRFWVLNFIFIVGILMNLSLILVAVLRKKKMAGVLGLLLLIVEISALIYFMI